MSKLSEQKKGISRRTFLKATAATAAISMLPLSGCLNKENAPQPQATDAPMPDPTTFPITNDNKSTRPGQPEYDKIARGVCAPNCVGSCGINCFVKDDKIIKVEPAEFPDPAYSRICLRGISNAMQRVYSPDRVKYPMKRVGERGAGEWERISWDDAIELIYEKMSYNIQTYGPQSNAFLGMTGNYGIIPMIIDSMMAMTYEATSISNFGLMGDNGCNMGFLPTANVQQDGHAWEDLIGCKTLIMFGCNYAETSMQDMHFLFDAQEKGMKLIVVDPRFSRTASKADWWIPIRPGTDAAMVMGMMHYIIKEGKYDASFINKYTDCAYLVRSDNGKLLRASDVGLGAETDYVIFNTATNQAEMVAAVADNAKPVYPSLITEAEPAENTYAPDTAAFTGEFTVSVNGADMVVKPAFQLLIERLEEYTPEKAAEICEVPAEDIIKLAKMYIEETPAALRVSQGTNRYFNGHLPTRALITLASICGNVGKEHAGISWAGGTLMRILFTLPLTAVQPVPGKFSTGMKGNRYMDNIINEDPYPIKLLWTHIYGWGTQGPDHNKMINEVLPKLDFVIVSEQMLNDGAKYADLVLPVTSYYEEPFELVTAWSNMYVQAREQAISPMWEAKTDYECAQLLAKRFGILEESEWKLSIEDYIRKHIIEENLAPEFRDIDFDELKEKKVVTAKYPENHVAFKDLKFNTPTGKLELYSEAYVEDGEELCAYYEPYEGNRNELAKKYPLTFMNCRTVYTTHSQHVNLPWILEVCPEPRLEMNPVDAAARSLSDGDLVEVFNDRGSYKVKVLVTEEIKPGCLNQRQGWWARQFAEGHYNTLLHMAINECQDKISESNFSPYDVLVEVKKA